jgi:hypothetical protein
MGRVSSDKTKSRGALVHGSTVAEQGSGGSRRLRLLLIYAVTSRFKYKPFDSNDKRLTIMVSHSTSGPSPGVAEAIVDRGPTATNEGPVLRYTG